MCTGSQFHSVTLFCVVVTPVYLHIHDLYLQFVILTSGVDSHKAPVLIAITCGLAYCMHVMYVHVCAAIQT